ncbi:unnamed protein product [Closterium sp. NIES-53]
MTATRTTPREAAVDRPAVAHVEMRRGGVVLDGHFQVVAAAVQANPMAVLLDSGCSHHLMGTKAVFVDMAPSDSVKHVCGFNGALQSVEGRGTVALQGEAGKRVLIPNMLYIPGIQANLLSAGQLKKSGVQLQGDGDEMLLIAATREVLGRARYNGRALCTDLPLLDVVAVDRGSGSADDRLRDEVDF